MRNSLKQSAATAERQRRIDILLNPAGAEQLRAPVEILAWLAFEDILPAPGQISSSDASGNQFATD